MTLAVLLDAVVDPHCGRSSDAHVRISVSGEDWEVQWGPFDAFGTASYWVNQTVRGRYSDKVAAIADGADLMSETALLLAWRVRHLRGINAGCISSCTRPASGRARAKCRGCRGRSSSAAPR